MHSSAFLTADWLPWLPVQRLPPLAPPPIPPNLPRSRRVASLTIGERGIRKPGVADISDCCVHHHCRNCPEPLMMSFVPLRTTLLRDMSVARSQIASQPTPNSDGTRPPCDASVVHPRHTRVGPGDCVSTVTRPDSKILSALSAPGGLQVYQACCPSSSVPSAPSASAPSAPASSVPSPDVSSPALSISS